MFKLRTKPQTALQYEHASREIPTFARERRLRSNDRANLDALITQYLAHVWIEGHRMHKARTALSGYAYVFSLNLRFAKGVVLSAADAPRFCARSSRPVARSNT